MTTDPAPILEAHDYDACDLEAMANLPRYYAWILHLFRPYLRGRGIELGAGIGTFSRLVRPYLDSMDLIEPSPRLAAMLEQSFAAESGIRIYRDPLEQFVAQQPPGQYDCAVMVNVLEHIADDGAALAGLHHLLAPGGHLLVFVPAMPALYSAHDRLVGHHRRYARMDLAAKAHGAGFEIRELRYFDLLGVLPWWAINTVGGATGVNTWLAGVYDRFCVPVTRALESVIPPLVGKNLILVAQRSAAKGRA